VRDRVIAVVLFVVVSSVYYATAVGISSSNDGSHYALLRAMVDQGQFRIDDYAQHAEGNDLAIRDDVVYSDRPPGTALMAVPFYVIGKVLPAPIRPMYARYDEGFPPLAYIVMLPVITGAAAVVILYLVLRSYEIGQGAALATSLASAFGTTLWKYGSVMFSHAPSALLIMGGVALAIRIGREGRIRPLLGLALGFVLGLSVVVEYSNTIFVVVVLIYITATVGRRVIRGRGEWIGGGALAVGMVLPIGFLLYYNTINFGGPFFTSYKYAINYPWAASFGTTFDVPLWKGLPGILWYGLDLADQENQGILLLMPVLLIGAAGVWAYLRRSVREAIFVLGLFLIYLLLFAKHHTFSGFTADTRYLTPFLGLWFIPISFALETVFTLRVGIAKAIALLIVYGLMFLSVRNIMVHIGFSYGYNLDPGLIERQATTPKNWMYILGNIFVNWLNLPLLWGIEGLLGAILVGVWRWRDKRKGAWQ